MTTYPTYFDSDIVAHTTFTSASFIEGSVPASFDAFLYKPKGRWNQLTLMIKLRIKLRQSMPPTGLQLDASVPSRLFITSPWTAVDWQRFISGAATQADMWNNKFWLRPPTTFTRS